MTGSPHTTEVIAAGARWRCTDLAGFLGDRLPRLPHVLRLLAENHLRTTGEAGPLLSALDSWFRGVPSGFEFAFRPNRILMHDTTCTPAFADIAGLRDAIAEAGGDPSSLSPQLPVEVSVDHSLAVDACASTEALAVNAANEITRNRERYAFLRWASANLRGVRVNPPGTGIMHTINLEQLATVLVLNRDGTAHPDMLLGTDSHTPMINGIGVMGWGVGGLEAEAVMFGQPATLAVPEVVGVRLDGTLPVGTLATDLALRVTHALREIGVAGSFVEFFGPGVATLSADARAVVANMAPEYGASTGFFPIDAGTVAYLQRVGRPEQLTAAIEPVCRGMGLLFDPAASPRFDRQISIDLSTLTPSIAGPRRPQDLCTPALAKRRAEQALGRDFSPAADGVPDGAVGVAAITSCTNTSDPRLLIAAGILARKARAHGLAPASWVKTSLAPGSPSASDYLARAGLLDDLAALGFDIVGFGCTTCIGNSGPLPPAVERALEEGKAICAVLSGNRNFPGRVHPKLDLGYLASPPLVVAYALKGTVEGDILTDPLGQGADGRPVTLSDIWPAPEEIEAAMQAGFRSEDVATAFARAAEGAAWRQIDFPAAARFPWDPTSRALRRPRFTMEGQRSRLGRYSAQALMVLGDDMTTDHISPAGWIDPDSAAGQWLIERGADRLDLNVYAAYRGNWEVMLRGLFTNRLARNHLAAAELRPSWTVLADGTCLPHFEAAERLAAMAQPIVLFAGERYGMGSSRDWAAKGVAILGVRAVIARSFERIHRTNLIGMGVLPLEITDGFVPHEAGITAADRFEIDVTAAQLTPNRRVEIVRVRPDGSTAAITCRVAAETSAEVELLRHGGVLTAILSDTRGRCA